MAVKRSASLLQFPIQFDFLLNATSVCEVLTVGWEGGNATGQTRKEGAAGKDKSNRSMLQLSLQHRDTKWIAKCTKESAAEQKEAFQLDNATRGRRRMGGEQGCNSLALCMFCTI